MNTEEIKKEAFQIFDGEDFSLVEKENHCIVKHDNDEFLVFDNYSNAQKYIDSSFKKYFDSNRHQLIHVYNQLFDDNGWRKMVDWNKAFEDFKSKYDDIVGRNFKEENRNTMLLKIEKEFPSYIESVCDNEGILSSFLYPFFNIGEYIEEVSDGLEYRVYDYGNHFYVPKVVL